MEQQTKGRYSIRNWKEYNRALEQRGSLTIWFSPDAQENWMAEKTGKRGHPHIYSVDAILCAMILKSVYRLPLRQLRGLLHSLTVLMKIALPIPCYSTVCRRSKSLGSNVQKLSNRRPTDIVFDSTGLKVYGEGEWKVRQHGAGKRRTWRKIHLAVCPDTQDIMFQETTGNDVADCEVVPKMFRKLPQSVKRGYGDGAYDKEDCYKVFLRNEIDPVIPPQKNAILHEDQEWMEPRNKALKEIMGLGGDDEARSVWKKLKGYHKRSLAETAMFRFKQIFGGALSSRTMLNQKAEVFVKCLIINRMNSLGLPKGHWNYS